MTVKQQLPYFANKEESGQRIRQICPRATDLEVCKIRNLATELFALKAVRHDPFKLKGTSFKGIDGNRHDVAYVINAKTKNKYEVDKYSFDEIIGMDIGHVFPRSKQRTVLAYLMQLSEMGDTLNECQANIIASDTAISALDMLKQ